MKNFHHDPNSLELYYKAKQLAGSVLSQSASGCRKTSPSMTKLASHVLLNKHLARGGDK